MEKYDEFWTTNTSINIEKVSELYNCKYFEAKNIPAHILGLKHQSL